MSLYNIVNGSNVNTEQLLNLLNLSKNDFGRYRDIYTKNEYIIVHTRCGGGNREDYEYMFDEISEHPWYSHDEDCDFDCTYADIFFKIPDSETQTLIKLIDSGSSPTEKWNTFFEKLK